MRAMAEQAFQLEAMAQAMAAERGSTVEEARTAIRIEAIRLAVALGSMSAEQANAKLASLGLREALVDGSPKQ